MPAIKATTLPPPAILKAFGIQGEPIPLSGGQGRSFLVNSVVLKPAEDVVEAEWTSEIMYNLDQSSNEFKIPIPLKGQNANFVQDGWIASHFCHGNDSPKDKLEELLLASRPFHDAIKHVPEPPFLSRRIHPWAVGDRVAWGEQQVQIVPALTPIYNELVEMRRDVVTSKPQLVHGDLSGNILFSKDDPPVIIDFSPFWRCVEYAEAIAIIDGIIDFDQGKELIDLGGSGNVWLQMIVRALIFRLVARSELTVIFGEITKREVGIFRSTVDMVKGII